MDIVVKLLEHGADVNAKDKVRYMSDCILSTHPSMFLISQCSCYVAFMFNSEPVHDPRFT